MAKGSTEARIYTKPLRPLTEETTLGFMFADFCRDVANCPLLPWQEWLGIHGLEIIGDLGGEWSFRFRTVLVLVARQNGKSKFLALLSLFFLYVLNSKLVLGTAQNLDTANEVWEDAVAIAQDEPELADGILSVKRGNSGKLLSLVDGERYKVVSASRSGGRGNSADLVNMDELREQLDWKAWGAVTKTTMARPNAQVWGFSNAGDASSIVLRTLRAKCHARCGDPDGVAAALCEMLPDDGDVDDTTAIFEWSAAPGCRTDDTNALAAANPSLGYGFMTERALLSARATDPDDVFRTECLCQWVEAVIESAFPEGSWEAGMDSASSIAEDSELTFAADMSADRETTSLAVCGKRSDGKWHVELIAVRKGFAWLTEWLRVRCQDEHVRLSYQGRGAPICSHIGDLEAIDGLELKPCEGANLGAWSGRFYDAVCACNGSGDAIPLMHRPQPALDHAAKIAQTKPMGDSSWAWNRQGSVDDISPLVACTFAFGLATENDRTEQGRVYESAYETRSLLII